MEIYGRLIVLVMFTFACHAQSLYSLDKLQGAWWSDTNNPTADFAIADQQVWLDYDSAYHPCSVSNGDVLIFELGAEAGRVEHRIISLDATTLVLENLVTSERVIYTRNE